MDIDSKIRDVLSSVPETAESPSPSVWETVQRVMKRRDFWRVRGKVLMSAGVLAVLGVAVLLSYPKEKVSVEIPETPETVVLHTEEPLPSGENQTLDMPEITENSVEKTSTVSTMVTFSSSESRPAKTAAFATEETVNPMPEKAAPAVSARLKEEQSSVVMEQPAAAPVVPVRQKEVTATKTAKEPQPVADAPTFRVIFPSAFTPNGDGLNDTYRPMISESCTRYLMRIYNRSSQLIFQTSRPEEAWDGTFRGQPQPHGAYVCVISCETNSGKHSAKGEFLLLRD